MQIINKKRLLKAYKEVDLFRAKYRHNDFTPHAWCFHGNQRQEWKGIPIDHRLLVIESTQRDVNIDANLYKYVTFDFRIFPYGLCPQGYKPNVKPKVYAHRDNHNCSTDILKLLKLKETDNILRSCADYTPCNTQDNAEPCWVLNTVQNDSSDCTCDGSCYEYRRSCYMVDEKPCGDFCENYFMNLVSDDGTNVVTISNNKTEKVFNISAGVTDAQTVFDKIFSTVEFDKAFTCNEEVSFTLDILDLSIQNNLYIYFEFTNSNNIIKTYYKKIKSYGDYLIALNLENDTDWNGTITNIKIGLAIKLATDIYAKIEEVTPSLVPIVIPIFFLEYVKIDKENILATLIDSDVVTTSDINYLRDLIDILNKNPIDWDSPGSLDDRVKQFLTIVKDPSIKLLETIYDLEAYNNCKVCDSYTCSCYQQSYGYVPCQTCNSCNSYIPCSCNKGCYEEPVDCTCHQKCYSQATGCTCDERRYQYSCTCHNKFYD